MSALTRFDGYDQLTNSSPGRVLIRVGASWDRCEGAGLEVCQKNNQYLSYFLYASNNTGFLHML
jgi:hypothetical protein